MAITPRLNGEEYPDEFEAKLNAVINDRAQIEQELNVYRAFFDECPISLVAINSKTKKISLWNEFATKTFGWAEREAIGSPLDLIIPPEVMPIGRHDGLIDGYQAGRPIPKGMSGDRRFYANTKTGGKVFVEVRIFPISTNEIALVGAAIEDVSVEQDLIQQLELNEAELLKQKAKLEKAYRQQSKQNRALQVDNEALIEAKSKADQADKRARLQEKVIIGIMILLLALTLGPMVFDVFVGNVADDMAQTTRDVAISLASVLAVVVAQGIFGVDRSGDNRQVVQNDFYSGKRSPYDSDRYDEGAPMEPDPMDEFPTTMRRPTEMGPTTMRPVPPGRADNASQDIR